MEAYMKFFVVALLLGLVMGTNGQTTLCRMTKDGLKACQPSVRAKDPAPPSPECCKALSNADLQCFCVFKNSNALSFYGIDFNQAMQLPAKCDLPQTFHCQ